MFSVGFDCGRDVKNVDINPKKSDTNSNQLTLLNLRGDLFLKQDIAETGEMNICAKALKRVLSILRYLAFTQPLLLCMHAW